MSHRVGYPSAPAAATVCARSTVAPSFNTGSPQPLSPEITPCGQSVGLQPAGSPKPGPSWRGHVGPPAPFTPEHLPAPLVPMVEVGRGGVAGRSAVSLRFHIPHEIGVAQWSREPQDEEPCVVVEDVHLALARHHHRPWKTNAVHLPPHRRVREIRSLQRTWTRDHLHRHRCNLTTVIVYQQHTPGRRGSRRLSLSRAMRCWGSRRARRAP